MAKDTDQGQKADFGKPRWSLLPLRALEDVIDVREYGVSKYGGEDGWQDVADGERRYVDAAVRHLVEHLQKRDRDPESGLLHLAHAACSVLFALSFAIRRGA